MTATDTYLLLRALCDELARCGLDHAATSPGSRCAPIVLSLVREPRIRCWSHIDERCAAFFALGAAKASGRPTVVTCTSGTAAANLAPAVIEAFHARVPLIVLTADRPPELRDVGAGQAIDQLKLYGSAVKWFVEVGVHDAVPERLRWIRALACRAYWTALQGTPGPVHLNLPLREPLVLNGPLPADPVPGRPGSRPWVTFTRDAVQPVAPRGLSASRPVIVAGAGSVRALPGLAARAQLPLLADPLSGARRGSAAIAHYDLLLRVPEFVAEHRPHVVIRAGELPTSKALRSWLAVLDCEQFALDPYGSWQDPDSVLGARVRALPLNDRDRATPDHQWLASWRAADTTAGNALADVIGDELSEPLLAARLGEWLPAQTTLFVASSMPVRDVESFFPVLQEPPRVLSNRGANGIDGTVSAAFGAAAADAGPVVLLIGDVALLHDIGGLLANLRLRIALTIVVLNNDGGGIFHFLPLAGERDAFEQHVATPHGVDFAHAAALYGCGYERPEDLDGLHAALARSIEGARTTIIEVRTNRERNLALHRRVGEAVRARLAGVATQPAAAASPRA